MARRLNVRRTFPVERREHPDVWRQSGENDPDDDDLGLVSNSVLVPTSMEQTPYFQDIPHPLASERYGLRPSIEDRLLRPLTRAQQAAEHRARDALADAPIDFGFEPVGPIDVAESREVRDLRASSPEPDYYVSREVPRPLRGHDPAVPLMRTAGPNECVREFVWSTAHENYEDASEYIQEAAQSALDAYRIPANSRIYLYCVDTRGGGRSVSIPRHLTAADGIEALEQAIADAQQSEGLNGVGNFNPDRFIMTVVSPITYGGCGMDELPVDLKIHHHSFFRIRGHLDNLCALRALYVQSVRHKMVSVKEKNLPQELQRLTNEWKSLKKTKKNVNPKSAPNKRLTESARKIAVTSGLTPGELTLAGGVGVESLDALAKGLSAKQGLRCNIVVYERKHGSVRMKYKTCPDGLAEEHTDEFYFLLEVDRHYHAVMKPQALFGEKEFCVDCLTAYPRWHSCDLRPKECILCGDPEGSCINRLGKGHWVACPDCNHWMQGPTCLAHHQENQTSKCQHQYRCGEKGCGQKFKLNNAGRCMVTGMDPRTDEHQCNMRWCGTCKAQVPKGAHQCVKPKPIPKGLSDKYLFLDLECCLAPDPDNPEESIHTPNLMLTKSWNGEAWPEFENLKDWVGHALDKQWSGFTVIAHNGQGYDFHPLMEALTSLPRQMTLEVMFRGSKIVMFTVTTKARTNRRSHRNTLRFIDSLNFLPFALRKFTKAFGLSLAKGFYPLKFNRPENRHYMGPLPTADQWYENEPNHPQFKEFKAWYTERSAPGEPWENWKELVKYCQADVDLLRLGCMKFRECTQMLAPEHDPFSKVTLAGSAQELFELADDCPKIPLMNTGEARKLLKQMAGGRTEVFRRYWKAKKGEKAVYVDFTSLYPYVNMNHWYPTGAHLPLTQESMESILADTSEHTTAKYMCIADVSVRYAGKDPKVLKIPYLHTKGSRLFFDLLPRRQYYTCTELRKALKLGYVIDEFHGGFQWNESIHGFARSYMLYWMKQKYEAKGVPSHINTKEQLNEYIDKIATHEAIELNPDGMGEYNPALYVVAKLYLNSLWGKMGQKLSEDFETTHVLDLEQLEDRKKLDTLTADARSKNVRIINRSKVCVQAPSSVKTTEAKEAYFHGDKKSSKHPDKAIHRTGPPAWALFTTAHGRTKLYEELLYPLADRVLYCDTDSAIVVFKEGENPADFIELSDYVGGLTNELSGNVFGDEFIVEFVGVAPKDYAYRTSSGKVVAKCKGVPSNRGLLNFEAMKQSVLYGSVSRLEYDEIRRRGLTKQFGLISRRAIRFHRAAYVKRRTLEDYTTEPWTDWSMQERDNLIDSLDNQHKSAEYQRIEENKAYVEEHLIEVDVPKGPCVYVLRSMCSDYEGALKYGTTSNFEATLRQAHSLTDARPTVIEDKAPWETMLIVAGLSVPSTTALNKMVHDGIRARRPLHVEMGEFVEALVLALNTGNFRNATLLACTPSVRARLVGIGCLNHPVVANYVDDADDSDDEALFSEDEDEEKEETDYEEPDVIDYSDDEIDQEVAQICAAAT